MIWAKFDGDIEYDTSEPCPGSQKIQNMEKFFNRELRNLKKKKKHNFVWYKGGMGNILRKI